MSDTTFLVTTRFYEKTEREDARIRVTIAGRHRYLVWPRIHRRLYRWLMPAEWPTELLPTEDA